MKAYHYVGLDVHKKTISYCVKQVDGTILDEGKIDATRKELYAFADRLPRPWAGAMEATLFTGWIYDCLLPLADELKVGHSYLLKAICGQEEERPPGRAQTCGCASVRLVPGIVHAVC
jgi:hypothetical protein